MSPICQKATQNCRSLAFSTLHNINVNFLYACEHQKPRGGQLFKKQWVTARVRFLIKMVKESLQLW